MAKLSYAMNLVLVIVVITLLCSGSRYAAATGGAGVMQSLTTDSPSVSETFSRYIQAYEKKDMATLSAIFANDETLQAFWPDPSNPFRIEGWNEVRRGLDGYLPSISSMTVNIRQPIVQVYGPVAIVSCHWSFSGLVAGKPQVGSGRGSYVFEKRNGAWKMVHLHESSMPVAGK